MTTTPEAGQLTRKDFVAPIDVRWCPSCGDYAILNSLQKVFPELGIPREQFVVISGIGCSSRFPYYTNTYGFHTIHGRAPTVATGVKVANPELSIWLVTGDGDGLSIGGNHLLHLLRRNPNMNVLLFNNRIYGLTKGQYSPTTAWGKNTKTTPMGSADHPVNPLAYALACEATFVARTVDTQPKHMQEVFHKAAQHKGTSFIEIFQNCIIFNNKAFESVSSKDNRDDNLLMLQDDQPLLFGKEKNKGIRQKGFGVEVVEVGQNGVTESDILTHKECSRDINYASLLTKMQDPEFPIPMGVLYRNPDKPTYEDQVQSQIDEASSANPGDLQALLKGKDWWEVSKDDLKNRQTDGTSSSSAAEEARVMQERIKKDETQKDPFVTAFLAPLSEALNQQGAIDPISTDSSASIAEAIDQIRKYRISSLPVIDKGKLVGIVTERDIILSVIDRQVNRSKTPVSEFMTTSPDTLPEKGSTVGDALHLLSVGGYRHLLIELSEGGYGLISVRGLMRFIRGLTSLDTNSYN